MRARLASLVLAAALASLVAACDSHSRASLTTTVGPDGRATFAVDNDRFQDDRVSVDISDLPSTEWALLWRGFPVEYATTDGGGNATLTDTETHWNAGVLDSQSGNEEWSGEWEVRRVDTTNGFAQVTFVVDANAESGDWTETPTIRRVL